MKTDIEKHDLHGPMKSVHVETAEFKDVEGHLVEEPHFGYPVKFEPLADYALERTRRGNKTAFRHEGENYNKGRAITLSARPSYSREHTSVTNPVHGFVVIRITASSKSRSPSLRKLSSKDTFAPSVRQSTRA